MENLLSIAVWIVSLSAGLQASPIPSPLSYLDFDLEPLQGLACENDSTFYTPTNVKAECLTKALECYMAELNVTIWECDADKSIGNIKDVLEYLGRLIDERSKNQVQHTSTDDCPCETYPASPFKVFLEKMDAAVQQHFSK